MESHALNHFGWGRVGLQNGLLNSRRSQMLLPTSLITKNLLNSQRLTSNFPNKLYSKASVTVSSVSSILL